jgi:hypothetical protein
MTTPILPVVPSPAAPAPAVPLDEWFDREVRPALLGRLAEAEKHSAAHHENTFRAIRHWLGELPRRAEQQPPEARAFAKAIVDELRGLLGDD